MFFPNQGGSAGESLSDQRERWLNPSDEWIAEVAARAYAATNPAGNWDHAWASLFEETGAGQPLPPVDDTPHPHPLAERRAHAEQAILGALLRLNHKRAAQQA